MKAFSLLLLLIGVVLCLFGAADLVTIFGRGDLMGGIGMAGLLVNGGILLVGVLFIALGVVMRKVVELEARLPRA